MIKAQTSRLFITMFENMSETYPLPDFLVCLLIDRFCACRFANSHHASLTHYLIAILPRTFTLFTALLYLVTFCAFPCRFYSFYCIVMRCHLPAFFISHFYRYIFSVACCYPFPLPWWSILRFCLCTSYCSFFVVFGKLPVLCCG